MLTWATVSQLRRANQKAGRSQPIVLVTTVFPAVGLRGRNQTSPASRHLTLTATMEKWPVLRLLLDLRGLSHILFYMLTPEQQHLMMRHVVPSHRSGTKITMQRSLKQTHEQVCSSQDIIKVTGNTVDKCHQLASSGMAHTTVMVSLVHLSSVLGNAHRGGFFWLTVQILHNRPTM